MKLQSIQTVNLNTLYQDLLSSGRRDGKGGLSTQSVRYVHVILRRCFEDAVAWGLLLRNPAQHAAVPAKSRPKHQTWNADEVRRFLDAAMKDPLFPGLVLSATTGMRRGEVLGLTWADVDLPNATLSVRQTVVARGYDVLVSAPKTERSRRSIYLDEYTVAVLKTHRSDQRRVSLELGVPIEAGQYVLTRPEGGPVHPQTYSATFERIVRDSGLPKIRLHDLRHTWATLALSLGTHPKVVSDQLGHSSIAVTMDTYSHVMPGIQRSASKAVAGLILGGETSEVAPNVATG
jgi:integrase